MTRFKDKANQKFGKLLALELVGIEPNKGAFWKCLCDCGKELVVSAHTLSRGNKISCGCGRRFPRSSSNREVHLLNKVYRDTIWRHSKRFDIKSDISIAKFEELIKANCHYCGSEPCHTKYDKRFWDKNGGILSDVKLVYNGLDRVDSSRGYFLDNVVTCCHRCNLAKSTLEVNTFLDHITKIYNHSCVGRK